MNGLHPPHPSSRRVGTDPVSVRVEHTQPHPSSRAKSRDLGAPNPTRQHCLEAPLNRVSSTLCQVATNVPRHPEPYDFVQDDGTRQRALDSLFKMTQVGLVDAPRTFMNNPG
jgi:hypothetical protein